MHTFGNISTLQACPWDRVRVESAYIRFERVPIPGGGEERDAGR